MVCAKKKKKSSFNNINKVRPMKYLKRLGVEFDANFHPTNN
jgi:hypothetical protein